MASLVKPRVTSYWSPAPNSRKVSKTEACIVDASGKAILKPGYKRKREKTSKFYGRVKGRLVPLHEDRDLAREMLAARILEAGKEAEGRTDPFKQYRDLPLSEHMEAFRQHLLNTAQRKATWT
jgi:hypothetical protein